MRRLIAAAVLGGGKPRRYLLNTGTAVGAGFIPARKGLNARKINQSQSI
jgi:hypothetical protein